MNGIPESIEQLMKFDPINEAEKFTGKRTGDSLRDPTAALGFAINYKKAKQLQGLLMLQDDTHFRTEWKDFLRIAKSEGFEIVHTEKFDGQYNDTKGEQFIIGWHPDGILLCAETHMKNHVNRAEIYYYLDGESRPDCTGGGPSGKEGDKWEISKDVREGLRHHLNSSRGKGKFLPQWPKQPFLWLLTYMDTKDPGFDYKAITKSRIEKLPKHVQDAICHS